MKRLQTEELRRLYELHHVVQDLLIPVSTLAEGMSVMDKHFDVYVAPPPLVNSDSVPCYILIGNSYNVTLCSTVLYAVLLLL
jgi:hypothetical protein